MLLYGIIVRVSSDAVNSEAEKNVVSLKFLMFRPQILTPIRQKEVYRKKYWVFPRFNGRLDTKLEKLFLEFYEVLPFWCPNSILPQLLLYVIFVFTLVFATCRRDTESADSGDRELGMVDLIARA